MFHGVRACEALFTRRPDAIVRVYLTEPRRRQFAKLVAWCAGSRKGFQVVAEENLARLTGSIHHEGIAILARQVPRWTFADLLGGAAGLGGPLVYLDGVQNPHDPRPGGRPAAALARGRAGGGRGGRGGAGVRPCRPGRGPRPAPAGGLAGRGDDEPRR
jgi:hypothetical protein